MSYDIELVDESGNIKTLDSPHYLSGGTYALNGTRDLWLNITYNYSKHFYRVLGEDGIRSIYGMKAEDSIPVLENAINKLDTNESSDYWEATEGNARRALKDLVTMAKLCPDGIWRGD